jgi:hypothetical protein
MDEKLPDLPPELGAKFLSFLHEVNGEFEVTDKKGLLSFIIDNGEQYPVLFNLLEIDLEAIEAHFESTGEVPPGISMVRKAPRNGANITELEVLHGPIPPNLKSGSSKP